MAFRLTRRTAQDTVYSYKVALAFVIRIIFINNSTACVTNDVTGCQNFVITGLFVFAFSYNW